MPQQHSSRVLAVLVACVGLAACADDPGTSVRLSLSYDAAWDLDRLDLRVGDRPTSTKAARTVVLLLPDAWAGQPLPIAVSGMRGSERHAAAHVSTTPELGKEVELAVVLTRLPCGAWCTEGTTTCNGDGVAVCEQRDSDTCLEWSEPVACPDETPYCSLGVCAAQCLEECTEGETRCDSPQAETACGEGDQDTCRDWLPSVACAAGETCSNGRCRAACADECTAGDTMCQGNGAASCGDLDFDGCLEWGPPVGCAFGTTCSNGACSAMCTDECTMSTCDGLTFRACGNFDLDPCKDLSPGTSCVPADPCAEGMCTAGGCTTTPKVCDDPPDPICVDTQTARTFAAAGTCSATGVCEYAAHDTPCAGGCTAGACASDWYSLPVAGAPSARESHTAVWTGTEMIVWGGYSFGSKVGDGGRFNPATGTWSALPATGAPSARSGHTAVWTGTEMIVWGGDSFVWGDGRRFNPATGTWSALPTTGAPSVRSDHTAVWTGTEMIVWGGRSFFGSVVLGDGGRFNPATGTWSALPTTGAPSVRYGHTAVWTGTEMIVLGGYNGSVLGNGARFNPATGTWSALPTAGAPSARANHTAVWTGTEMIVWGGATANYFGDGGRFNPATGTWNALLTTGAPSARAGHTAVWTATEMMVWGGYDGSYLGDGGRFVP